MRTRKPMPDQRDLDFSRGYQLNAISGAKLNKWMPPKSDDGKRQSGVSVAALRHVLRVIDDHGRGREAFLSCECIARETGIGVRQVKRVIHALVDQGLLMIDRRKPSHSRFNHVTLNHYKIIYTALSLLCGEQSDLGAEQSDLGAEQSDLGTPKPLSKSQNKTPPPYPQSESDQAAWREAGDYFRQELGLDSIDRVAAAYQSAAKSPLEFRRDVADAWEIAGLPEHASKLKSRGGAVLWFLERGRWPAEGMPTLEEYRQRQARYAAARERERLDREADAEYERTYQKEKRERLARMNA